MLGAVLDVLFPPRCAACRTLLPASERASEPLPFCDVCEVTLEPITSACARCGVPGPDVPACPSCLADPPPFLSARAPYLYGAAIAEVLHRYKYEDHPELARPLAARLCAIPLPPVDVVAPVPLHAARRMNRTYDQALYLAQEVARLLRVPCAPGLLERTRATGRQVGRHRDERAANVAGAFRCPGPVPPRVLLIDDVVTTGATVAECARALESAGAREVHVASVARAA